MSQNRAERREAEKQERKVNALKREYVRNMMKKEAGPFREIPKESLQSIYEKMDPLGQKPKPVTAWKNNHYIVQAFLVQNNPWCSMRLMIRRNDEQPIHDWHVLQHIKNELFGPSSVALEVYPAQRNLVDDANMYWLWIMRPGVDCPCEFKRY